jgi:hypothetical protein
MFSSLTYFPKLHESIYKGGLERTSAEESFTAPLTSTTTLTMEREIESTRLINNFSYGLFTNLSINLGLNWQIVNDTEIKSLRSGSTNYASGSNETATSYDSSALSNNGLEDIVIGSIYRIKDDELKVDLISNLNISGKREIANSYIETGSTKYQQTEGNAKSGGTSLEAGGRISGIYQTFEWSTSGILKLNGKKTNKYLKGDYNNLNQYFDYDESIKEKIDLNFSAQAQFLLNEKFSFGPELLINYFGEEEATSTFYSGLAARTDDKEIKKPYVDINFGVNLKYEILTNALIAFFFCHNFGGDQKSIVTYSGGINLTTDVTIKDRSENKVGILASVKF